MYELFIQLQLNLPINVIALTVGHCCVDVRGDFVEYVVLSLNVGSNAEGLVEKPAQPVAVHAQRVDQL